MENAKVVDLSHEQSVELLGGFVSPYLSFEGNHFILEVFGYGNKSVMNILTSNLKVEVSSQSLNLKHCVNNEHFGENYYRIFIHLDEKTKAYEALYMAKVLSGYGFREWTNVR